MGLPIRQELLMSLHVIKAARLVLTRLSSTYAKGASNKI